MMPLQLVSLTAQAIRVPLKREIKHASHARQDSLNLLVRCRLANGIVGWGEGVPRSYVTGESVDGAFEQLEQTPLASQLSHVCADWPAVFALCEALRPAPLRDDPRGCYGNALRCAIELAVLDAFARAWNVPLSAAAAHYEPARPVFEPRPFVRYSGAITAEGERRERLSALKMRLYGFAQCKVKVGVAGADDAARLRHIRAWIGRRMDLRLDANEAWSAADLPARLEPLLACRPTCLEQPVPHAEVGALAELRRKIPLPIMLDESLTGPLDAEAAIRDGTCDLFNLRLSKCGGFLACLRLAARATAAGLGFQLGCHPGETGVLSAAGRHFATSVRDVRYLEGSYDRHLLRERLTREDVTFGYGGRAPALTGPGLGVSIDESVLSLWTERKRSWTW